jgi:hypothetical protein
MDAAEADRSLVRRALGSRSLGIDVGESFDS